MIQILTRFLTSPTTLSVVAAAALDLLIGWCVAAYCHRRQIASANPVEQVWAAHEAGCVQCRRALSGDEVAVLCATGRDLFRSSITATHSRLVREQRAREGTLK